MSTHDLGSKDDACGSLWATAPRRMGAGALSSGLRLVGVLQASHCPPEISR